jgi:aspartate aminotransferase-like enzyme
MAVRIRAIMVNLSRRQFVSGKFTAVDTFRVGCIGAIGADTLRQAVDAVADSLSEMGVRRVAPD